MSDFVYTVLAYKANGSTYCRGCVVDSHDSDFEFKSFSDEAEAIEFMARHYEDYDVTLLLDGEEDSDDSIAYDTRCRMRDAAFSRAKVITNERAAKRKADQEKRDREYKQEKEASERRILADLKAKYEVKP